MTEIPNVIMVGNPFVENVVVVFDQKTGRERVGRGSLALLSGPRPRGRTVPGHGTGWNQRIRSGRCVGTPHSVVTPPPPARDEEGADAPARNVPGPTAHSDRSFP
jgi:hypothetical protein